MTFLTRLARIYRHYSTREQVRTKRSLFGYSVVENLISRARRELQDFVDKNAIPLYIIQRRFPQHEIWKGPANELNEILNRGREVLRKCDESLKCPMSDFECLSLTHDLSRTLHDLDNKNTRVLREILNLLEEELSRAEEVLRSLKIFLPAGSRGNEARQTIEAIELQLKRKEEVCKYAIDEIISGRLEAKIYQILRPSLGTELKEAKAFLDELRIVLPYGPTGDRANKVLRDTKWQLEGPDHERALDEIGSGRLKARIDQILREDTQPRSASSNNFYDNFYDDFYRATQPRSEPSNLYDVLGVSPTATPRQIRHAYRAIALSCHPDQHGSSPPKVKAKALKRFREATDAYTELKNSFNPKTTPLSSHPH